jgi:hypothetical protein
MLSNNQLMESKLYSAVNDNKIKTGQPGNEIEWAHHNITTNTAETKFPPPARGASSL